MLIGFNSAVAVLLRGAPRQIFAAVSAVDVDQGFTGPPVEDRLRRVADPLFGWRMGGVLFEIAGHHLDNPEFPRRKGTAGDMFFREVLGEGFLSSCAIVFAAASADLNLDVEDGGD